MEVNKIIQGDCLEVLKTLPDESIDCCVTSPPYWGLRDYGVAGQMGLEATPEEYVKNMVALFGEVKRVLKKEGTLWLNLGDSYLGGGFGVTADDAPITGKQATNRGTEDIETRKKLGKLKKKHDTIKTKDLVGIPWMTAFALRADGWYLRQDIIWEKPNAFPESVKDRCTKSHEYVFLMAKNKDYYCDMDAIKEPVSEVSLNRAKYGWHGKGDDGTGNYAGLGQVDKMGDRFANPDGRNKRSVWRVNNGNFSEAHFATYPEELISPMITAGCPEGGVVLDPFMGAGTTGLVARKLGRNYMGIELNPEYIEIAEKRINKIGVPLFL